MLEERYQRNAPAVTPEETLRLNTRTAAVVGLGGLGGYVVELLCRLGVGTIIGVDDDAATATNLNRQLLVTEADVGKRKTELARARIAAVNSETRFLPHAVRLDEANAETLLAGADIVLDCCDNVETRFMLERAAERCGIPLVHGAIDGFMGQVGVCLPGDRLITACYGGCSASEMSGAPASPAFTPALVASAEVAEAAKLLLDRPCSLHNRLLHIDLLTMTFTTIRMA